MEKSDSFIILARIGANSHAITEEFHCISFFLSLVEEFPLLYPHHPDAELSLIFFCHARLITLIDKTLLQLLGDHFSKDTQN